jgi:hypothetical protein
MRHLYSVAAAALALWVSSCGGGPSEEGFTIAFRFVAIDPAVLERLELSVRPQGGATFEAQPESTHENGAITTRVESDGTLTLTVSGDHVRSRVTSPDGVEQVYELQVWTDDEAMRAGPQLVAFAVRSGARIGEGQAFLPTWPPPLEEAGDCTLAGSSCRAQLNVTCYAGMASLCRP